MKDATGDISANRQNITYTPFNKVASIIENGYEEDFTYDAGHNRVMSVLTNAATGWARTRCYIGGCEVTSSAESGAGFGTLAQYVNYVNGGDRLAAIVTSGGLGATAVYSIYKDNQGSILTATDNTGAIVPTATQSFDAWGRYRSPTTGLYLTYPYGSSGTPDWMYRGYTGQEHMPQFDLINMNARLYDPTLSRMLSPDNYVQAPFSTQNYNRYSYCMDNPTSYTDPTGNVGVGWAALAGFAVGYLGYVYSTGNWGITVDRSKWSFSAAPFEAGAIGALIAVTGYEGFGLAGSTISGSTYAEAFAVNDAVSLTISGESNEVRQASQQGQNGQLFLAGIEGLSAVSAGFSGLGQSDGGNANIEQSVQNVPLTSSNGLYSAGMGEAYQINIGKVIGAGINSAGLTLLNNSLNSNGTFHGLSWNDAAQAGLAGFGASSASFASQLTFDRVKAWGATWNGNWNSTDLFNFGAWAYNIGFQPGAQGLYYLGSKTLYNHL